MEYPEQYPQGVERKLWLMGFEDIERREIIELAAENPFGLGPLAIGEFVMRFRTPDICTISIHLLFCLVWRAVMRQACILTLALVLVAILAGAR